MPGSFFDAHGHLDRNGRQRSRRPASAPRRRVLMRCRARTNEGRGEPPARDEDGYVTVLAERCTDAGYRPRHATNEDTISHVSTIACPSLVYSIVTVRASTSTVMRFGSVP